MTIQFATQEDTDHAWSIIRTAESRIGRSISREERRWYMAVEFGWSAARATGCEAELFSRHGGYSEKEADHAA